MVVTRGGCLVHNHNKESTLRPLKPTTGKPSVELPLLGGVPHRGLHRSPGRVNSWNPPKGDSHPNWRQKRRVRFSLPPPDAGVGGVAGVFNKSERATGGQQPRASLGHVFSNFSGFSRRTDAAERRDKPTSDNRKRREQRTSYHPRLHVCTSVLVTSSPAARRRAPPSGRYSDGTLSPTAQTVPRALPPPTEQALLRAARDPDDATLRVLLRDALEQDRLKAPDLNAVDPSGRTVLSYIASNGSIDLLELILQLPVLDPNLADNEGNTPLHFAAQAGQIECLNCMLSRCRGIEIDARNNLGFTPLMKAAIQGRNKCAKLLLFAGANPTLRDTGRGFRADQWARFCGRYVCADVIEKHARQRLLERSTSMGSWGTEPGAAVAGKVPSQGAAAVAAATTPVHHHSSHGLKSKLRKVFRTSSSPQDQPSSTRLVSQLTTAALCASSPVLPSGPMASPVIKTLTRPLSVPRLQVTLANSHAAPDTQNNNNNNNNVTSGGEGSKGTVKEENGGVVKPLRSKKKK